MPEGKNGLYKSGALSAELYTQKTKKDRNDNAGTVKKEHKKTAVIRDLRIRSYFILIIYSSLLAQ